MLANYEFVQHLIAKTCCQRWFSVRHDNSKTLRSTNKIVTFLLDTPKVTRVNIANTSKADIATLKLGSGRGGGGSESGRELNWLHTLASQSTVIL